MKRSGNIATAMIWKEYREMKWFLLAGLFFFLLFPALEGLNNLLRDGDFYTDAPEGMVLGFGGLLAIIIAVGATCRDLQPKLQIFWQSRPLTLSGLLITKYIAGLVVMLMTCCIPLLLQMVNAGHLVTW